MFIYINCSNFALQNLKVGFSNSTKVELENILSDFDEGFFGEIIRAKGVLNGADGWIFFDYVPSAFDIRDGEVDVNGKVCIIGKNLNSSKLKEIFR